MNSKTNQAADLLTGELLPKDERTNKQKALPATVYHVANLLGTGEKNRVTTWELCSMLNCEKRSLQRMINEDRKNGAWIISFSDSVGGYCLAETQEQYEDFCKWLIAKQLGSASFFRKQIKNYDVILQQQIKEE